jgi:hypothetical protein
MLATIALATENPHSSLELSTPKKRRRSDIDQLGNRNVDSERCSRVSLKHDGVNFLVADRGITHGEQLKRCKRAMHATMSRKIITFVINDDGDMFECTADKRMVGEGLQASRRSAIAFSFDHIYGNPARSEWSGRGGVLAKVMHRLDISPNSLHLVRKVFQDVAKAIKDKKAYDPHSGPRERGRKVAIEKGSREAAIVFLGMKSGIGITETTVLVNEFRTSSILNEPVKPISWSAVASFIRRHPQLVTLHKRKVKKSGKDDPDTAWAKAREAQALQLRRQLQLGLEPETRLASESYEDLPSLFLDGIGWFDEFHMKVRLGHASPWEILLCRDPSSGDVCAEEDGGVWDEESPTTSAKYPGEARVCAGALMRTTTAGVKEGVTLPMFSYTGMTVVGPKAYAKAKAAELARVRPLKGCWGANGAGYKERWPGTWEAELEDKVSQKLVCITKVNEYSYLTRCI